MKKSVRNKRKKREERKKERRGLSILRIQAEFKHDQAFSI